MTKQKKGFKEAFGNFFESPDRVSFRELLKNNTGEYNHIDFKEQWFSGAKLAKHILGFANSKGGVLVFGVKENENKTLSSAGLKEIKDKTDIVTSVKSYIPETIKFDILDFSFTESEWGEIKGKKFQVLVIEDRPGYCPFLSLRDGDGLKRNRVYCRGSVNTEEATHNQLQNIINRRIDTGYSTTREIEFRAHINQLDDLYSTISEYNMTVSGLFDTRLMTGILRKEKNPKYPEENFEVFILRMIQIKKEIIQKIISGR